MKRMLAAPVFWALLTVGPAILAAPDAADLQVVAPVPERAAQGFAAVPLAESADLYAQTALATRQVLSDLPDFTATMRQVGHGLFTAHPDFGADATTIDERVSFISGVFKAIADVDIEQEYRSVASGAFLLALFSTNSTFVVDADRDQVIELLRRLVEESIAPLQLPDEEKRMWVYQLYTTLLMVRPADGAVIVSNPVRSANPELVPRSFRSAYGPGEGKALPPLPPVSPPYIPPGDASPATPAEPPPLTPYTGQG